jgi:hypothetical protein
VCASAPSDPDFVGGSGKLQWDLVSSNPWRTAKLLHIEIIWPGSPAINMDKITFSGCTGSQMVWDGAQPPSSLSVSGNPLCTGAFSSGTMEFKFASNPPSGTYIVSATFEGCSPISGTVTK